MTIDASALEDRLYADALAADHRIPWLFFEPKTKVSWNDIESYVRERAVVHGKDLLVSPASMEGPFNRAREEWFTTTSFGGGLCRKVPKWRPHSGRRFGRGM